MRNPMLEHLDALVGEWETEATHQSMPDTVVRGHATFQWLEGGHFMIGRERNEHPDFPDSISILGCQVPEDSDGSGETGGACSMHTFDSRGYIRVSHLGAEAGVWRFWGDWPGFSVRFTGTFSADGNSIAGLVELNQDGATWEKDLWVTYTRVK
jgi:hypothetical protein